MTEPTEFARTLYNIKWTYIFVSNLFLKLYKFYIYTIKNFKKFYIKMLYLIKLFKFINI